MKEGGVSHVKMGAMVLAASLVMPFSAVSQQTAPAGDEEKTSSLVETNSSVSEGAAPPADEQPDPSGPVDGEGGQVSSGATSTEGTLEDAPPSDNTVAAGESSISDKTHTETLPETVYGDEMAHTDEPSPPVAAESPTVAEPDAADVFVDQTNNSEPKEALDAPIKENSKDGVRFEGEWTHSIVFSVAEGAFRFEPRGWLQPRFDFAIRQGTLASEQERFHRTGFSLNRGRVGFQAWLFDLGHFYLDTGWKSGSPTLVDYFLDVGPKNGDGPFALRVGFFRPYFSRQLLHATTKLAMIDYAKAWSDGALDLGLGPSGRQLGIAVQGFAFGGLTYGVGLWNGSDGYDRDGDFMYGGRVAVHPLGLAGVGCALRPGDESDATHSTVPRLAIGAAFYAENRNHVSSDILDLEFEDIQLKGGGELAFQYAGISVQGELFWVKRFAKEEVLQTLLDKYHRAALGIGGYLQFGYAVVEKRFELVGRFDVVDENVEFRGVRYYPTVGATFFIYGNNLKIQTQYRVDVGSGYRTGDPGYINNSHNILMMLQASI